MNLDDDEGDIYHIYDASELVIIRDADITYPEEIEELKSWRMMNNFVKCFLIY